MTHITGVASIIGRCKKEDLRNIDIVEKLVQVAGLHNDSRISDHYGLENGKFLVPDGMLQQPRQLAAALVHLSEYPINTYLEIGTFNGVCTTFIAAYLRAFNPLFSGVTVDIARKPLDDVAPILEFLGVKHHLGTSESFKGEKFDLCFIDGDHTLKGVSTDYENVGKYAKTVMFHDIYDTWVEQRDGVGVKQFWTELRQKYPEKCYEFVFHPEGQPYFGIGVLHND